VVDAAVTVSQLRTVSL